jgi:pimeloyl-ACP methyl ester carboxylesterase
MNIIPALIGVILIGIIGYGLWNRLRVQRWLAHPLPPGKLVKSGDKQWYVTVKGTGSPVVVIAHALGAFSPEWWGIQDQIAEFTTVLSYDRAGYGWSDRPTTPRTSQNIAHELHDLLQALNLPGPFVLVGHSQGGLYVNHFARLFPEMIAGAVLLDPLSPDDNRFKKELPPNVYQSSGVDKSATMKIGAWVAELGLLRALRSLLLKSPPFYYFHDVPQDRIEIIWQHTQRPAYYYAALDEYQQAHIEANNVALQTAGDFPPVPLKVLYHDPQVIIDEIVKYGGLSTSDATQVDHLWEELIREYLTLSPKSEWIPCPGCSHYIHLGRPYLVIAAIRNVIAG